VFYFLLILNVCHIGDTVIKISDYKSLQEWFAFGLCPSTVKVYVVAITAFHALVGGTLLGQDPLITCFLRGTLWLRPATHTMVMAWDIAIVL